MLRKECVSNELIELLKKLQSYEELEKYYLVGGTSLALQLGHRISEDIDLFTVEGMNKNDLRFILNRGFKNNYQSTMKVSKVNRHNLLFIE